jgi:hypothetical protein
MIRRRRRAHLIAWLVIAPVLAVTVLTALVLRPPAPAAAPVGTPR